MPVESHSNETLLERYKLLEGDHYMAKFVNEVMECEGSRAYCMYCKPDELYRHIESLTGNNIRVMVASMIKPDNSWNTVGMQHLDSTLRFLPNDNLQERNSPMCVAVALDRLGFNVPIDQRIRYGVEFSQTSGISYGGHVMAVNKEEY